MSEPVNIRFVGDLARLEAGPEDRFVLMADRPITRETRDRIMDVWKGFSAAKLLILDAGMKLTAVNFAAAEAAAEGKAPQ